MTAIRLAIVLSIVSVASAAHAQSADDLNSAGMEAFSEGRYADAADAFRRAYDDDPDPIFRKSEAVAWFKAGRCDDAIAAANAFLLQWSGGDPERDEASSVVANCKVDLATTAMDARNFELGEQLLGEAEAVARDQYTRDRISAARVRLAKLRRDELETAAKTIDTNGPSDIRKNDPTTTEPRRGSAAGVVLLSAGGALLASGLVLHIVTLGSTVPKLERATRGSDEGEHTTLARRVDTARILVPVLYGLGFAGLGVGAWLSLDTTDNVETSVLPSVSSVGLSFSSRF